MDYIRKQRGETKCYNMLYLSMSEVHLPIVSTVIMLQCRSWSPSHLITQIPSNTGTQFLPMLNGWTGCEFCCVHTEIQTQSPLGTNRRSRHESSINRGMIYYPYFDPAKIIVCGFCSQKFLVKCPFTLICV